MDSVTVFLLIINNQHNIIHVQFIADKVAWGKVSFQGHWSSPANMILPISDTHVSQGLVQQTYLRQYQQRT
jgi:hypothetical protein